MDTIDSAIVTIIGVLLALPLLSVTALDSFSRWLFALGVLIIGIKGFFVK
ncbi:MAG: hypothetical protein AABW81_01560 [Nanoarchaeota archaeon]